MSRMGVSDIFNDDDLICPYHRYSLGIYWRPSTLCQSPYHEQKKPTDTHPLPADYYGKFLEMECFKGNNNFQFPIGQKVCRTCLTRIQLVCANKIDNTTITGDLSSMDRSSKMKARQQIRDFTTSSKTEFQSPSQFSNCSSNSIYMEKSSLDDVNKILMGVSKNIPLLKYQIQQPIRDLSIITIRELKRYYESVVKEFSTFICESMAPGQGQNLLQLFEENDHLIIDTEKLDPSIQSIVEAYHSAPSRKWKIFLLSTVAEQFTNDKLQSIFNCNRYIVDKSRHIRHQNDQFNSINRKVIQRTRLEKPRLEFFFDFLFSSGLIQDVAHGTAFLKFDQGDKVLVPHVVRTMMKNHVFQLYHQHCIQTSYNQPLGRSTVLRLLNVCKMREKKVLCGLDSFSVDGNIGFDILERLVKELHLNQNEEKNILQLTQMNRKYLKFEYQQNVTQDTTNCATHCRLYALSHPTDKNFKVNCNHSEHTFSCIKCNALLGMICRMEVLIVAIPSSERKDELISDLSTAKTDILSWMFHIIRGVQQDKSKQFVMNQLNINSGVLLSDWAMKVLPQTHREKMDDWFGKKGISLHVDVLFYIDQNNNLKKTTYFTAIDRCLQDMSSVLCVFEHVIKEIKKDIPHLNTLFTRSDNAGCYSGAAVILTRQVICSDFGISLKRTDFSEPQRGKDQADRDIAIAKSCLKAYTNRGGNLINAESIKKALDESLGSLHNTKTSVITVDESACILPKIKIDGITKYHSIVFQSKSITFWQYFDIGNGKSKKVTNFEYALHKRVLQPFNSFQNKNKEFQMKSTPSSTVFFCSIDSCSGLFDSEEELMVHEQNAEHIYNNECSLSTMDRARYLYIDHLKGARFQEEISNQIAIRSLPTTSDENVQLKHNNELEKIFLSNGYAIRRRQKSIKMTYEQQKFFTELFYRGENTGKKVTIDHAYQEMRSALKLDHTKLFSTTQYLTKNQIRSFFGRLAKKRSTQRRNQETEKNDNDNNNISTSSDEDVAQDYYRMEQHQQLEEVKADVIENISNCYSDDEYDLDQLE